MFPRFLKHIPSIGEAKSKLDQLNAEGISSEGFNFKHGYNSSGDPYLIKRQT